MPKVLHAVTRDELRKALVEHLRSSAEPVGGADLVQEVSLEEDAESSRVVAAMWTLVDDGQVAFEPGARLRLLAH